MSDNAYERFKGAELILRDELAIDRTILANERTVIAYLRGALTMVIVGVTFLHFDQRGALFYMGLMIIPMGVACGILGVKRYRKMDHSIRSVRRFFGANPPTSVRSDRGTGDAP